MQISFSDIPPCSPSNGIDLAAIPCSIDQQTDGSLNSMSTVETSENSTLPHGSTEWIASQRDSLVRIFQRLEEEKASAAQEADLSKKFSGQLTLFDQESFGSKTAPGSEPEGAISSYQNSWREDTPGETEPLQRLMWAPDTNAIDGGALLPTLTVCGNYNRRGASLHSGDGIATALRRLPTLTASDAMGGAGTSPKRTGGLNLRTAIRLLPPVCATDYKSPYSVEGYKKQTQKRSKPLRDTLVHSTGHRLTPAFAEWWMGWPLGWTESKQRATARSRLQQRQHG